MGGASDAIGDSSPAGSLAGRPGLDLYNDLPVRAVRIDDGGLPVVYTTTGEQYPLGAANYVGRELRDRPAVFLMSFTWTAWKPSVVSRSRYAVLDYRIRRPLHRFVFLCNDERELAAHRAAGLDAILCNHNAFLDEDLFTPGDDAKQYSAVYTAAIVDWKRHELARLIDSCVHITYGRDRFTERETLDQLAALERLMPSHRFPNPIVDGRLMRLQPREVAMLLRQSRCGLCLSAEEGAMFASMEYLLAGLPVVSTPSAGGRDTFADSAYWLTVAPDAEAVADGVRQMIARDIAPERIRSTTLTRIMEHRARLRTAVTTATDGKVQLPADLGDRRYRFNSGLGKWLPSSELKSRLHL
jgi:glycosyltransferase involved in cell wall biosynthesis